MNKKLVLTIGGLIAVICVLVGCLVWRQSDRTAGQPPAVVPTPQVTAEEEDGDDTDWTAESLRDGLLTVIAYDKRYEARIEDEEAARQAIREYGKRQRQQYFNPAVVEIELRMEEEYDLLAVNLGEIEEETAKDIEAAFSYMYETYPQLRGSLTNLTLGNFDGKRAGNIALTQNAEFILSGDPGTYPFVVKYEIILNGAKFRNRDKLLKECALQVQQGYWPEGSNITSIVVHELGHQLLNTIAIEQFDLRDACFITEENGDAYSRYVTDSLSVNQTVGKSVMECAYDVWKSEYGHTGSEEDFRRSISDYAAGIQEDGGISYGETFAEAIADIYLNGEQAADASQAIRQAALAMLQEENSGEN